MYQDDQAFLNAAVQQASGNETSEKLTLLEYQQAVLEMLQDFQPCDEHCAHIDFTLLRKRVEKLRASTHNAMSIIAVVPTAHVRRIFKESRTLLLDVAQLCPACQQRLQRSILVAFRTIHTVQ